MNNWGWVVVVVVIVVFGTMNTNKTPAKQKTQTMAEQKQTQKDFTPNDVFSDEDVKWLEEHGFTSTAFWWVKEFDDATMTAYKRADSYFVCYVTDADGYLETDQCGETLRLAIKNAVEIYRKRKDVIAKASDTLSTFVQESCQ